MSLLRTCHIITGTGVGGAERMLQKLVMSTEGTTLQNEVVSLIGLGPVGEELRAAGIPVHALSLSGFRGAPRAVRQIRSVLREMDAQVVPTWMYHADLIGGWAARDYPVLWGIRHSGLDRGGLRSRTRAIAKLCAWMSKRIPQLILSNSQAGLEAHSALGYDSARMRLTPNGFDVQRFRPRSSAGETLRAKIGVDANAELIGTLSRHDPAKDLPTACAAMSLLLRQRPNAHALFFGVGLESSNAQFQALVREHFAESAHRVHGLGPRSDIEQALAGLDLFYLASRTEAFPNALGEAMSTGLPSIATDVGDCRLIAAGHAQIVAPRQPAELATAIDATLSLSLEQRIKIGKSAREHIQATYSLEHAIARYVEVYREAVELAASSKVR